MARIVLTDGGMGQELLARTGLKPTPLWSAQVMMEMPEAVEDLHLDYIRAGAKLITVNAYSAEPCRLKRFGAEDQFTALQQAACRLAQRARDRAGAMGADVRIAGCLPPLEWSYVPEMAREEAEAALIYDRVVAEQAPHVDLFLCETHAAAGEAAGAARAASASGLPVWVSWTVGEERAATLRSGEPLPDAIAALGDSDVEAVLVNCSSPEAVGRCMAALGADGRPYGGYANGFTPFERGHALGKTVEDLTGRTDLGPAQYADHVMRWVADGATIVGGCCETGPAHITEIARRLLAAGHEIVAPGPRP